MINVNILFEVAGYLGSIFVLASFLMKNIKWIRIINIIGAVFFVIYGIYTATWATTMMNFALIIVHIVYLVKMHFTKKITVYDEKI